jgi:hypothetical protein
MAEDAAESGSRKDPQRSKAGQCGTSLTGFFVRRRRTIVTKAKKGRSLSPPSGALRRIGYGAYEERSGPQFDRSCRDGRILKKTVKLDYRTDTSDLKSAKARNMTLFQRIQSTMKRLKLRFARFMYNALK